MVSGHTTAKLRKNLHTAISVSIKLEVGKKSHRHLRKVNSSLDHAGGGRGGDPLHPIYAPECET